MMCDILCASPAYLRPRGLPQEPVDLARHDCLMLQTPSFPAYEWLLEGPEGNELVDVSGPIQVNIAESLVVAIRAGMGVGMLPGLQGGTPVRVLPIHRLQGMNIHAIYASRKFSGAKIKTWVEFLRTHVPRLIAHDEAVLAQIGGKYPAEPGISRSLSDVVEVCRGLGRKTGARNLTAGHIKLLPPLVGTLCK